MYRTIILTLIALLVLNASAFGAIYLNDSCQGLFPNPCKNGDPNSSIKASGSIPVLIVRGASSVLASDIEYKKFLKSVEEAEFDGLKFESLSEYLNGAISNMETAREKYAELYDTSLQYGYDIGMTHQLSRFPYRLFRKNNKLFSEPFDEVTQYLKRGDIKGVYSRYHQLSEVLLTQMYALRAVVEKEQTPDIKAVHALHQDMVYMEMFGQYTAMVFHSILK